MKKTYTKKQITEAIAYWKKHLKKMNESENVLMSSMRNVLKSKFIPRILSKNEYEELSHVYDLVRKSNQKYQFSSAEYDARDFVEIPLDEFKNAKSEILQMCVKFDLWNGIIVAQAYQKNGLDHLSILVPHGFSTNARIVTIVFVRENQTFFNDKMNATLANGYDNRIKILNSISHVLNRSLPIKDCFCLIFDSGHPQFHGLNDSTGFQQTINNIIDKCRYDTSRRRYLNRKDPGQNINQRLWRYKMEKFYSDSTLKYKFQDIFANGLSDENIIWFITKIIPKDLYSSYLDDEDDSYDEYHTSDHLNDDKLAFYHSIMNFFLDDPVIDTYDDLFNTGVSHDELIQIIEDNIDDIREC